MRRLLACSAAFALLVAMAPLAGAQEPSVVTLTLVRQTPWNSPKIPVVDLTFRAQNTGTETLTDLSAVVTVYEHVASRSQYDLSLTEEATIAIDTSNAKPLSGSLAPGASRTFSVSRKLTSLPQLASYVYPMKVELASRSRLVGLLRTPIVYLVEKPVTPLALSWTVVLDAPILFEPGGVFRNATLERQIAPAGRLAAEIAALRSITPADAPTHVDLAVSPALILQLVRMQDGYDVRSGSTIRHVAEGEGGAADAQHALEDLSAIAARDQVEVSAMPFSEPLVPSLLASGLSRDLRTQLERGRSDIQHSLQSTPDPTVLRPPASAIDDSSVDLLARRGVDLLLLDGGTLEGKASSLGFAPPPTASIPVGPAQTMEAIVPDGGVQALLGSQELQDDPVLGAHVVLGELAQIWLERPSIPRGVALTLSELLAIPSSFFGPFARSVASAPWLEPLKGTKLAETFKPSDALARVGTWRGATFSGSYVQSLKHARKRINVYQSALVGSSPVPSQLSTLLLIAEAGSFTGEERLGRPFIDHVEATIDQQFHAVQPDVSQPVTLTSSTSVSSIPVHIVNGASAPLQVTVQLVSPRLRFADGSSQTLKLTAPDQTVSFGVTPRTTGRFPVQVLVRTPSGRVLSSATLIVRSTAYNRIALVITIGAGLMLLALWVRRVLIVRRAEPASEREPASEPEPERSGNAP
jgi:hypothetical protein